MKKRFADCHMNDVVEVFPEAEATACIVTEIPPTPADPYKGQPLYQVMIETRPYDYDEKVSIGYRISGRLGSAVSFQTKPHKLGGQMELLTHPRTVAALLRQLADSIEAECT